MKIATFGSGNMARALGYRWAEQGHEVFFGSRSAEKGAQVAVEIGHGARGGHNDQAAMFADVILHTVRDPPATFLSAEATAALKGKIIIDLNNHDFPRDNPVSNLAQTSLAEQVQQAHPDSKVVKAYNTMAMEVFDHPPVELKAMQVSAFLAGDDEGAMDTVAKLSKDLGLVPVNFGGLKDAWLVEAQGDFVRTLIFKDMDPMMTINAKSITKPSASGRGRKEGTY